jgi:UDP-3-O-[3-hydroxymyristoyl] glucosamine N-acyltransferase
MGHDVRVGNDCIIQAGAIIGEDGFGYYRDETGRWVQKDHKWTVVIDSDVHIGANACVDRGSWRDTHIQQGVRIDNLVHIAHNVIIGRNAIVVAGAELSGSVVVGVGAWIGPNACIKERVQIGEYALVGMGAVVTQDVAPNTTVAGNPARVINDQVGVRQEM